MKKISVYYENPHVCDRYFKASVRRLKSVFKIHKIETFLIDDINKLRIPECSSYPRILLTKRQIKTQYYSKDYLEGIGVLAHNVALISYKYDLSSTIYLMAHEIGHLLNIPHCNSESCLMGVSKHENEVNYAWRTLSKQRILSKRLLCGKCKEILYSRAVTTESGG